MASQKQVTLFGLLGNVETSYNSGTPALAPATDGILLAEPAVATIDYVHDGARGLQPGAGGLNARAKPSGRSISWTASIEGRGAGSAYSVSVVPQDLHTYLLISGHEATGDFTGGAEKYTYAPESGPTGFDSGHFEGYAKGQKFDIQGAYASMAFTIDGPGFMMFEFETQGISDSLPSDAALPAIAYQSPTTKPPKAEGISLDINGVTSLCVRSINFNQNRTIDLRADINTGALCGFVPGRREPSLEIVVESVALATLDPYALRDAATEMNVSFTVGTVQYNRIAFTAPQAQITNVSEDEDGAAALWTLEFILPASSPVANDEYSIITN